MNAFINAGYGVFGWRSIVHSFCKDAYFFLPPDVNQESVPKINDLGMIGSFEAAAGIGAVCRVPLLHFLGLYVECVRRFESSRSFVVLLWPCHQARCYLWSRHLLLSGLQWRRGYILFGHCSVILSVIVPSFDVPPFPLAPLLLHTMPPQQRQ